VDHVGAVDTAFRAGRRPGGGGVFRIRPLEGKADGGIVIE
jgi:hypothetical protein